MRHLLPIGTLAAAEARARALGVGAEQVLIAGGSISEDSYVAALARSLGLPFEPLDRLPRAACALDDARLIEAAAAGLLPVQRADGPAFVVAPRHDAARRLTLLRRLNALPDRLALTSSARLRQFVERHATRAITHKAAEELRCTRPDLCAARGEPRALRWALIGAGLAAAMWLAPAATQTTVGAALALVFLAWIALRLIGFLTPKEAPRRAPALADDRLPTYTIIVALYREAAVVEGLVAALDALDYPREKLDIKLVLESDDLATRAAIAALDLGPPYEVVMAPRGDPRTKPKALNAALLFARGAFTAVYDAEDRPEPDQLRRALERFRQEPELACVQARLSIYNAADDWLTRLFAAEYCGLFDVFLPALAACRLPFPLGGSSNHFRTAVLRAIGGWDPYNVTEDADLGVRLARFGHRMGVIASTTFEEAPVGVAAWLWQRTRWFKGWMQTWIVHMRAPVSLARELPLSAFLAFQLTVGGTVVAALVHPLFLAALIHAAATGQPVLGAADDATAVALAGLHGLSCLAGYLVTTALCLLGLSRRRLLAHAWALALLPVLWLLLSLAAWCAVFELVRDPYRWNKTEHGCAKSPRRAHA